jgi:hypothetical protein
MLELAPAAKPAAGNVPPGLLAGEPMRLQPLAILVEQGAETEAIDPTPPEPMFPVVFDPTPERLDQRKSRQRSFLRPPPLESPVDLLAPAFAEEGIQMNSDTLYVR